MKALVIGGTGPSGPHTVNGLIERGYDVTILHGGQHEVEFVQDVEHIHTDPHFAETLEPALAGRTFDLALATYGRMRIIANLLKGRTGRFIGVGGPAVYAPRDDPRWGPLGQPVLVPEDSPRCDDPAGPRFNHLMWVTEETVMQAHRDGHQFQAIGQIENAEGQANGTGVDVCADHAAQQAEQRQDAVAGR